MNEVLSNDANNLLNDIREDLIKNYGSEIDYSTSARVHCRWLDNDNNKQSELITDYKTLTSKLESQMQDLLQNKKTFKTLVCYDEITKKKFCIELISDSVPDQDPIDYNIVATELMKGTIRKYPYNNPEGFIYLAVSSLMRYLKFLILDAGINCQRSINVYFKSSNSNFKLHYL